MASEKVLEVILRARDETKAALASSAAGAKEAAAGFEALDRAARKALVGRERTRQRADATLEAQTIRNLEREVALGNTAAESELRRTQITARFRAEREQLQRLAASEQLTDQQRIAARQQLIALEQVYQRQIAATHQVQAAAPVLVAAPVLSPLQQLVAARGGAGAVGGAAAAAGGGGLGLLGNVPNQLIRLTTGLALVRGAFSVVEAISEAFHGNLEGANRALRSFPILGPLAGDFADMVVSITGMNRGIEETRNQLREAKEEGKRLREQVDAIAKARAEQAERVRGFAGDAQREAAGRDPRDLVAFERNAALREAEARARKSGLDPQAEFDAINAAFNARVDSLNLTGTAGRRTADQQAREALREAAGVPLGLRAGFDDEGAKAAFAEQQARDRVRGQVQGLERLIPDVSAEVAGELRAEIDKLNAALPDLVARARKEIEDAAAEARTRARDQAGRIIDGAGDVLDQVRAGLTDDPKAKIEQEKKKFRDRIAQEVNALQKLIADESLPADVRAEARRKEAELRSAAPGLEEELGRRLAREQSRRGVESLSLTQSRFLRFGGPASAKKPEEQIVEQQKKTNEILDKIYRDGLSPSGRAYNESTLSVEVVNGGAI